jgi:glutathione S-transferase
MEELDIPYESEYMDMADLKKPPFEKINPNGRVPAIHDPNTGITLWESAAIAEYLIDNYDKTHKISYDTVPEKYYIKQWLAFQVSGQGPYFGQAAWFRRFHHEKLPSAIKRYQDQVVRVFYVLDLALEQSGTGYLVGDKCTVADLMFIMWDSMTPFLFDDEFEGMEIPKKYPAY